MTDIYVYDAEARDRLSLTEVTFHYHGEHLLSIQGKSESGHTVQITNGYLRMEH